MITYEPVVESRPQTHREVAKGFSIRVQAGATYEGLTVAGTKHGDLAITFGVNHKNEWTTKKQLPPTAPPPQTAPKP